MSARPENPHPSFMEFDGWYNIPPRSDGFAVLQSVPNPPDLWWDEIWEVFLDAREWFGQFAGDENRVRFDPFAEDEFVPISDMDDRTVCICHVAFDRLTMAMLDRIQVEFLTLHPLWRVALMGDRLECSILIYPTAVRFGDLPRDFDADEGLRLIASRAIEQKEQRVRPARAFLARVERLVQTTIQEFRHQRVHACGFLDHYPAENDPIALCLVTLPDTLAVVDLSPGHPREPAEGDIYGLNRDGDIISRIEVSPDACYRLTIWLLPADYRGPLTIVECESGKRHEIELRSEDIIRAP